MSDKVRRQKDIIDGDISSLKSATKKYSDYFNGEAPIYITYYQIADAAAKVDSSLDDTSEVVGTNSSLKYYRIKNVPVYGLNTLDINNQLSQRGLESAITGDFVITPVLNIVPRGGEFFIINDSTAPDLAQHLFVITDVQYDRATSDKFYKCSFKLYPKDADNIYNQVIKNFIYDPSGSGNTDGVGDSFLITEEDAAQKDKVSSMIDGLIDTYTNLFYSEGMDTFVYQKPISGGDGSQFEYYWCPYICHFIYKTDLLKKSNGEFLQEIFCQDINENDFPSIYSERGYRKSLFYAVEMQDSTVMNPVESSFLEISPYNLNMPLNLPFFSSGDTYHLIDVYHQDSKTFWLSAFDYLYKDESSVAILCDPQYKFTGSIVEYFNNLPKTETGELTPEANISGDSVFYQIPQGQYYPSDLYYLSNDGTVSDAKITSMITNGSNTITDSDLLFSIIKCYINGALTVTDSVLSVINSHYYEPSIKTYFLLPMVIYALKNM